MKNIIGKILQKNLRRLPAWLELWSIRHGFIYPEPKVFQNQIVVTYDMSASQVDMVVEIKKQLVESLWQTIEEIYLKYRYVPRVVDIEFYSRDRFEEFGKVFGWKFIAHYSPLRRYRDIQELIEAIENFPYMRERVDVRPFPKKNGRKYL